MMPVRLIIFPALLVPFLVLFISCSSSVEVTDDGEIADSLITAMEDPDISEEGVDISEAVPEADERDEQADTDTGAPASRMRLGIGIEDALDQYYQTLTNYTLSYLVMAQEAFAASDLGRAVHLAERSAELLPNDQVFIFKAYLFEMLDNYDRALTALENVDLERAELVAYRDNLALNQARLRSLDRETPPVPGFIRPVERSIRSDSVASGYYVRLPSFDSESQARLFQEDIEDYFAIAFGSEPFQTSIHADSKLFVRAGDRQEDVQTGEHAADLFSVLVGPYETRKEATIAFSRLMLSQHTIELVEKR